MSEVNKVPSPKVVLASMPDLECGFSRELFALWATHPKNSVILTSRSPKGRQLTGAFSPPPGNTLERASVVSSRRYQPELILRLLFHLL